MRAKATVDRGWAWMVLIANMILNYLLGILIFTTGIVHVAMLDKYQEDVTSTSWASGIIIGVAPLAAPLSTLIVNNFGCRTSVITGGLLIFAGSVASSFATSIWHVFIAYGLVAGVGFALTLQPTFLTVVFYFEKYRGLVSGMSQCGVAVGTLTGPLIFQQLLDSYGLGGMFLLLGAMQLHTVPMGALLRPTEHEGKALKTKREAERSDKRKVAETVGSAKSSEPQKSTDDQESAPCNCKQSRNADARKQSAGDSHCSDTDKTTGVTNKAFSPEEVDEHFEGKDQTTADQRGPLNTADCEAKGLEATNKGFSSEFSEAFPGNASENSKGRRGEINGNNTEDSVTRVQQQSDQQNHSDLCDYEDPVSTPTVTRSLGLAADKTLVTNAKPEPGPARLRRPCDFISQWLHELRPLAKNWAYIIHVTGVVFFMVALSGIILHLPEYARTLGTSATDTATLFVGSGVLSIASRLLAGVLTTGDRLSPLTVCTALFALGGVSTTLFPLYSATYVGQHVFSALFGFATGGYYTLVNLLAVELVGMDAVAVALGVEGVFQGVGYLLGPPFAALIVDNGGTYEHGFLFLGLCLCVATGCNIVAQITLCRRSKGGACLAMCPWKKDYSLENDIRAETANSQCVNLSSRTNL